MLAIQSPKNLSIIIRRTPKDFSLGFLPDPDHCGKLSPHPAPYLALTLTPPPSVSGRGVQAWKAWGRTLGVPGANEAPGDRRWRAPGVARPVLTSSTDAAWRQHGCVRAVSHSGPGPGKWPRCCPCWVSCFRRCVPRDGPGARDSLRASSGPPSAFRA